MDSRSAGPVGGGQPRSRVSPDTAAHALQNTRFLVLCPKLSLTSKAILNLGGKWVFLICGWRALEHRSASQASPDSRSAKKQHRADGDEPERHRARRQAVRAAGPATQRPRLTSSQGRQGLATEVDHAHRSRDYWWRPTLRQLRNPNLTPGNVSLGQELKTDSTHAAAEWSLPAIVFYFLSFKATENLHIDKAIHSHNKNTPVQIAKVPSQIPWWLYGTSHATPQVYFLVSLRGCDQFFLEILASHKLSPLSVNTVIFR